MSISEKDFKDLLDKYNELEDKYLRRSKELETADHKKSVYDAKGLILKDEVYRTLFNSASDSIFLMDGERFIACNPATLTIYGCDHEDDIIGHTPWEFSPEFQENGINSKELALKYIRDSENIGGQSFDWIHKRKNGELFEAEISLDRFNLAGKNYIQAIVRDVSFRKNAERAARDMEEKLYAVFNGLVSIPVQGYNEKREVIYWNEASSELYGYSRVEAMGKKLEDLIIPDEMKEAVVKLIDDWHKKNIPIESEYLVLRNKFNKPVHVYSNHVMVQNANGEKEMFCVDMDVSPLKETEKTLMESEERFRLLSDVTFEGIIVHKDGVIIDVNKAFERISGYNRKEVLGESFFQAFRNFDADLTVVKRNMMQGHARPYRIRVNRKDGKSIWLEIEGRDIDYKGSLIRIAALRDISEKVRMEIALQNAETQYESVINNSQEGIFVIQNGVFVFANPTITKISGFQWEDIEGMPFMDLVFEEDRAMIVERNKKRLMGQDMPSYDFRILDIDGKPKWVHINAARMQWNDQDAVLCFVSDVDDRKKAEIELIDSRKKFLTYIESSPLAIYIFDKKGNYSYVNTAAEKMLGLKKDVLLSRNVRDIFFADDLEKGIKLFEELLETGKVQTTELRFKQNNDLLSDFITDAVKLSDDEYIAYCQDITGLVNTQRELREKNEEYQMLNDRLEAQLEEIKNINVKLETAKSKAEESERLKTAFLANMSHEIRTPMNGILGFTKLLQEPELSGEQKRKYIDIIQKSGDRMLNTVNDIIEVSRIETGQVQPVIKAFDVCALLREYYEFFKLEADKKKLELKLEKLPGLNADLLSDKSMIESILVNFLKNAIKYTNKGFVFFGCKRNSNELLFYVRDTGIGIPENRQKAVFERFIQADIEDKDAREGSGLGLAIAYAYSKMLGGRIELISKVNEGSEFRFFLPLKTAQEDLSSPKDDEKSDKQIPQKKLKILLTEDDEASRMHLSIILKGVVSELLIAKKGEDAIKICRERSDLDLVLMDIKLPGMTGYEATRAIKKIRPQLPVIAQTAYAMAGDRAKALEAGCDDYISKPINKNELMRMINAL